MTVIFTAVVNGRIIRLTLKQCKHIAYRHPEMVNKIVKIEETLIYPEYKIEKNKVNKYYKYIKEENNYIMVAFKILNGDGFVLTSYITRKIQK